MFPQGLFSTLAFLFTARISCFCNIFWQPSHRMMIFSLYIQSEDQNSLLNALILKCPFSSVRGMPHLWSMAIHINKHSWKFLPRTIQVQLWRWCVTDILKSPYLFWNFRGWNLYIFPAFCAECKLSTLEYRWCLACLCRGCNRICSINF